MTSPSQEVHHPDHVLKSLTGSWSGTCRTWLRPDDLADESEIRGTFSSMVGSSTVRHSYEGSMSGQKRIGEETLAYSPGEAKFQVSWVDSFHMSSGILFSQGDRTDNGFAVNSQYRMAPDQDYWGWKTVYMLKDENHLVITSYNITPDGQEGKAVEVSYERTE